MRWHLRWGCLRRERLHAWRSKLLRGRLERLLLRNGRRLERRLGGILRRLQSLRLERRLGG